MNLRMFITAWNIVNTSINSFCFSKSLLLDHKWVQFQWFFNDISVLRWRQARNNHLRFIQIFA